MIQDQRSTGAIRRREYPTLTTTQTSLAPGPWVERWLSPPRFRVYMNATKDDRAAALDLYEWNSSLTAAVLHDLGHLEVALRNAYDAAFTATWQGHEHWLFDPGSPIRAELWRTRSAGGKRMRVDLNRKPRGVIDDARRRFGWDALPGKIIAELPFGFWRYLSDTPHEKSVWVPHLHTAFPSGASRVDVDGLVGRLHALRNRAAHCEPLLKLPIPTLMDDLRDLAGLLCPPLSAFITARSPTERVLATRPG